MSLFSHFHNFVPGHLHQSLQQLCCPRKKNVESPQADNPKLSPTVSGASYNNIFWQWASRYFPPKKERNIVCVCGPTDKRMFGGRGREQKDILVSLSKIMALPLLSLSPKPTADDLCVILLLLLLSPFPLGKPCLFSFLPPFFFPSGATILLFFRWKASGGEETRTKSKNFNNNLFFLLKSACFPISFLKKISRNGYFLFLVNILLPNRKKRVWRKKQRDYNSFSNAPRGKKRRKKCGKGEKVG